MVSVKSNKPANREKLSAAEKHSPAFIPQQNGFEITDRWPLLALAALSFVISLPLFAPWSVWPLAYIVLVPWLIGVCAARRTRWVYISSYLLGCAFFFTHWRWLYDTTPPGYIAGALYFAAYFPLAAWPVRHFYRTRQWGIALVFAIVWTLTEVMRSRGPLAFPWFLFGHTQIRLLPLVQIADITGVYGVSFLVALINAWIANAILYQWARKRQSQSQSLAIPQRQLIGSAIFVGLVLAGYLGYGIFRMRTMEMNEGPKIAVLQGDFLLSPIDDPNAPSDEAKQQHYFDLMQRAAEASAEMIVLPETPWPMYLNRELRELPPDRLEGLENRERRLLTIFIREAREWHNRLLAFVQKYRTYLVLGGMSQEPQPKGSYPETHRYNSAFVYPPDGSEPSRYDKIHLVMFGEYVPFRYTAGLHAFYRWLNSITPWGADGFEYSLTEGKEFKVFDMKAGEKERHFGITICYEDVIPQVFRRFVVDDSGKKKVDFMLNISNDGWFGHGDQQPQHLVNCAFRAIENRVGVARSVNTGVSGFIRPDGSWYALVADNLNSPRAGGSGLQAAHIMSTPLVSFYSRFGDIFGALCAVLGLWAFADAFAAAWRSRGPKTRAEK